MSDPDIQGEPTMEEILASIRKIISEDGPDESSESPSAGAESVKDDDVLELTERIEEEDGVSDTKSDTSADDKIEAILSGDDKGGTAPPAAKDDSSELISGDTKSGVTSAMAQFAGALVQDKAASGIQAGAGPTLDALVLALLEPQLKTWLDEHLEPLVERLVKEELKRMARRAEDV